jgi:hypothetical protein
MLQHRSYLFAAGATLLLSLVSCSGGTRAEPSFYINLQDSPVYVKAGFDRSDTEAPDLDGGSWRVLRGWRAVMANSPELRGLPGQEPVRRAFLSPVYTPPREWTFVIPFTMTGDAPTFPGLFLAAIGENWEIYLNGVLVRAEMHMDESGRITEHHTQRDVFFPVERRLFNQGENLLAFRIAGDPTDWSAGFEYSAPYYLADYGYIARKNSEIAAFVLIGIYLLAGVYHFLVFAIHRQERYHIFCGIFSLGVGLYYLTRTHKIYDLITDSAAVVKLEYFVVFFYDTCVNDFNRTARTFSHNGGIKNLLRIRGFSGAEPARVSAFLRQRRPGCLADNGNCGYALYLHLQCHPAFREGTETRRQFFTRPVEQLSGKFGNRRRAAHAVYHYRSG